MKKLTIILVSFLISLLLANYTFASIWSIDSDHSTAGFAIKHMTISTVRGNFSAIKGNAEFDKTGVKLISLQITIDANSINTGVKKRDDHLKSPDFFDVTTFPVIDFRSKSITTGGSDTFMVTGDLTMHGVTREITIQFLGPTASITDPWGNVRKGANITTKINRKDYKIIYNKILDNGSLLIGDTADVSVEMEFIEQK